jgi:hypothetical protein
VSRWPSRRRKRSRWRQIAGFVLDEVLTGW